MKDQKFTFDDILLVPSHAEYDTREFNVSSSIFFSYNLTIPVLSSPMDTITGTKMMDAMWHNGAIGVHHRYCEWEELEKAALEHMGGIAISPSGDIDKIINLAHKIPDLFFVIDVAHGDSKKVMSFCFDLIKSGVKNIVSGNVVTCDAVHRYLNIGVEYFRAGVGNGSRCLTRTVSGFGYPQASVIHELYQEFGENIVIIADGGFKNTGDIVKSFSLGASYVMTGYLLAGTDECPTPGYYRGMASKDALETRKKEYFIEGDSISVAPKGSVSLVLDEIEDAIKHACHYGGVLNYKELVNVEKIRISESSFLEGLTRK